MNIFKNLNLKNLLTIGAAVATGVAAFSKYVDEEKKAKEFKEMKEFIDELKAKESE